MASQITVTGTAGPAKDITAAVFTDVLSWSVDCATNILTIVTSDRTLQVSIAAATTFTVTKSGSNYTVSIS